MSETQSLVVLAQKSAAIETLLIESGGELTPELEEALTVKEEQLPAKIDGYALFMERMEMVAEHYSERARFYEKFAKSAIAVADRLETNIKFAMETMGTTEILGNDVRFKIQNTAPSVVTENEFEIPDEYKSSKQVVTIDKKKIAEVLKAGGTVPGARLNRGTTIRKYANTPGRK